MTPMRRLLIRFYLLAAVAGAIIPCAILLPAIRTGEYSSEAFFDGLFANPSAAIFSADALLASVVFLALVVVEGRRADMPRLWLYPLLICIFGLSCAMPFFLAMRERARGE